MDENEKVSAQIISAMTKVRDSMSALADACQEAEECEGFPNNLIPLMKNQQGVCRQNAGTFDMIIKESGSYYAAIDEKLRRQANEDNSGGH